MLTCFTYNFNTAETFLIDKIKQNLYSDFGQTFPSNDFVVLCGVDQPHHSQTTRVGAELKKL